MFGEVSREGHPRYRIPERIPLDEFHEIAGRVVLPVVELVITNPPESIFLLRRVGGEGGAEFDGLWHLPGGYVMGGELRREALERLARKELDRPLLGALVTGIGTFDNPNGDWRGPMLHSVYRIDGLPAIELNGGAYFRKLPTDLVPHQRDFLTQLAGEGLLPIEP